MTGDELRRRIEQHPRVRLAHLPTPLQPAPRLAESIGVDAPLLIKRDDLTGLGLGGNKARMLEYILGEAVERGFDHVIVGALHPSSYCQQMAAACARLGLGCDLVLGRSGAADGWDRDPVVTLVPRLAASIATVAPEVDAVAARIEALTAERAAEGRSVFQAQAMRDGALQTMGLEHYALGYAAMFLELEAQLTEGAHQVEEIWVSSTEATQAGLVLAALATGSGMRVIGVSSGAPEGQSLDPRGQIASIAHRAADLLGLELELSADSIESVSGDVVGNFAELTDPARLAIGVAARTEGLIVDPDYTGKALAALLESLRARPSRGTVFVHTGGVHLLFAYARELAAGDLVI